ncbi:uncharacterized protein LAESUDRAFT_731898 [Laetiporus sulphureus 93-53]|uniref:Protein NO VEIN C-terminal domain-containing protein n=1 Tax=Laetiporus sulphureus 93-53 TaxID=1314785 RepID=A0A165BDT6_9APHY|nr:uncharacterized protein LAESUDRAFT_731898 [Laetiporus sulphureus 93-53]KZT00827.1 hypothetical protein LAESUDRAFT_731898 [Laetiporus sulphureus 93-53]
MDLVTSINRSHGLDDNINIRPPDDPIVVLRGKLERACERLSTDLYNTKTHFLLEFIQNADDNNYDADTIPTLQLHLEQRRMIIRCNEKGFTAENVKAICDIGGSTKKKSEGEQGYIGEKGIGFKAAFVVASQVHVASNVYTFRFDRDAQLGMINPIWDQTHQVEPGWTTFRLDIAQEEHLGELSEQLRDFQPSLLLFLRKLRSVGMRVTQNKYPFTNDIIISRIDPAPDIMELERVESGQSVFKCRYTVVKHVVPTYAGEPKREGIEQSEIVLAFPVTLEGEPIIANQHVYAFLPVIKYGFTFVIQADFLTSSSRESIIIDSQWNLALLPGIVTTFLSAANRFQEHPVLKDTWIRFVPLEVKDPFGKIADHIALLLRTRPVLRSTDGLLSHPERLLILPEYLCTNDGKPLIPSTFLAKGLRYLAKTYDASRDIMFLTRLGVRTMSDIDFIESLTRMDHAFPRQSDEWHEAVCDIMFRRMPRLNGIFHPAIMELQLLPLSNGSWAAAKTAADHVFISDLEGFDELQLSSIRGGIKETSTRYRLYSALGVRRAGPAVVAERILESKAPASLEVLIVYARFFFEHRRAPDFPSPSALQVMDEDYCIAHADELYLDLPDRRNPLRSILPSTSRFLHSAYSDAHQDRYWIPWIQDSLGVNTAPRLVSGQLSLELQQMTWSLETPRLLSVLREYWPQLSRIISPQGVSQLSRIIVSCDDGRHPLSSTALRRHALRRMRNTYLHFLPASDPNDAGWDFLAEFGVMTEVNLETYIKILVRLQNDECQDEDMVTEIYRQLDARFHENPTALHVAFHQHPLLYASRNLKENERSWVEFSDVYWDGPPSMTSKATLKRLYPTLEDFFRNRLSIKDAPLWILVNEFKDLARQWKGHVLPPLIAANVEDKILDITDYLVADPAVAFTIHELAMQPIFPVHIPNREGQTVLKAADEFYVPDRNGNLADRFRDKVLLLAVSPTLSLVRIQPLLDCNIWNQPIRYLEHSILSKMSAWGIRTMDESAAAEYKCRLEYVERELYHKRGARIPPDQSAFLIKLKDMRIEIVDSISSTLTLGCHIVHDTANSSIEEHSDHVRVLVTKACSVNSKKRDREVCSRLAERLSLDRRRLQQFIDTELDDLGADLDEEGITSIPAEYQLLRDHSPLGTGIVEVAAHEPLTESSDDNPDDTEPATPEDLPVRRETLKPLLSRLSKRANSESDGMAIRMLNLNDNASKSEPAVTHMHTSSSSMHSDRSAHDKTAAIPISVDSGGQKASKAAKAHGLNPLGSPFVPRTSVAPIALPTTQSKTMPHAVDIRMPQNEGSPLASISGQMHPAGLVTHDIQAGSQIAMALYAPMGAGANSAPSAHGLYHGNVAIAPSTDAERLTGIQGELYVFHLLHSFLGPGFREANWTSELRGEVQGFTTYDGDALADFKYLDKNGILTGLWYGEQVRKAWANNWPTYHIEVKATGGLVREPFHVSQRQLYQALHLTNRANSLDLTPTDVYAIINVWGLRTRSPSYAVYLDVHRCIYDGRLAIQTDVYLS